MKKIAMIDHYQAEKIILNQKIPLVTETVSLVEALGRYLAEPILSPMDSPPFDKSAMDGFAITAEDNRTGCQLEIQETVAAGDVPIMPVRKGCAARIMTGAMIPDGSRLVSRVEFTREKGNTVEIITPEKGTNIILQGENTRAGSVILDKKRLDSRDAGIMAASGVCSVTVNRKLRVANVTTGSELA